MGRGEMKRSTERIRVDLFALEQAGEKLGLKARSNGRGSRRTRANKVVRKNS